MLPQSRGELNGIAPRVSTLDVGVVDLVAKTFTKTDEHADMSDDSSSTTQSPLPCCWA